MFNKAIWITTKLYPDMLPANAEDFERSVYLRKVFDINKKILKAELTICALGLGVYTINGLRVTDAVLCTPYTIYDKRVLCNRYDITELLRTGKNAIGVHLGNGFYNNNMETWKDKMASWRDVPKVIFSIHITYTDNTEEYINTDRTLKTYLGPALFNHMRQGEMYDARCDEAGWDLPYFNDEHWKDARRINPPGGNYELTDMPPIRVTQEYKPVKCENGIYDFGVNISGWVKIKVKCEAGREITLTYDERLNEDGTKLFCDREFKTREELMSFRGANAFCQIENLPFAHKDIYITKGGDWEEWSPSFCYHGFRYVKVLNAPENFEIVSQFVHTDFETVGSFWCNNDKLNMLHDMSVRTLCSNNVGIPTDCPQREQAGWPGDTVLSSNAAFMNFDMYDFYKSWVKNYKDVQRANGHIPCLIPAADWGFNWGSSPLTDGAILKIPYNGYLYTKRRDMIETMWDNIVRYFDYIETIEENGLVEYGIGADWSCSNLKVTYPVVVRDTLITYYNLITMAELAQIIGKDREPWLERAKKYKDAWYREFYHRKELWQSQTFLAQSVYYGILEGDDVKNAAKRLADLIKEEDYHFNTGVGGVFTMFTVLSEYGYADVLLKAILNETYPSYWYWAKCGLTTFAEDWDMSQSLNHQMFCEIDNWLYRYVGGIKFTGDGLIIEPVAVDGITDFKVTHRGIIVERHGDDVEVTLPCNAYIKIGTTNAQFEKGTYHFKL